MRVLLGAAALALVAGTSLASETAKFARGDYLYFEKTNDGARAIHSRCMVGESERKIKRAACAGDVEEMLDENTMASDMVVGSVVSSPGHGLLAYTTAQAGKEDTGGYTVEVKNIKAGSMMSDQLEGAGPDVIWGACRSSDGPGALYYTRPVEGEPGQAQLWRHIIGKDQDEDEMLYEEDDADFTLFLSQTTDRRYLIMTSKSNAMPEIGVGLTTEVHFLRVDAPAELTLVTTREPGMEYYGGPKYQSTLYIRTDQYKSGEKGYAGTPGFRIMKVGMTDLAQGRPKWRQLGCMVKETCKQAWGQAPTATVTNHKVFKNHIVVEGEEGGVPKVWLGELSSDERVHQLLEVGNPPSSVSEKNAKFSLSIDPLQDYEAPAARFLHGNGGKTVELRWPERADGSLVKGDDRLNSADIAGMFAAGHNDGEPYPQIDSDLMTVLGGGGKPPAGKEPPPPKSVQGATAAKESLMKGNPVKKPEAAKPAKPAGKSMGSMGGMSKGKSMGGMSKGKVKGKEEL